MMTPESLPQERPPPLRPGGGLHVVATPIGNLGDLTSRAANTLAACDIVACEDTRVTGKLLNHLGIRKPLVSYRDENELRQSDALCREIASGKNVALVSDAGMPTISDPGFRIVRQCRREGLSVSSVPGPCATTSALSVSGLPSDAFLFLGFLPPKTSARRKTFRNYQSFPHTLVFYESPHRIDKFLDDVVDELGPDRTISICKELTKIHERVITAPAAEARKALLAGSTKGEFVVLIAPDGFLL